MMCPRCGTPGAEIRNSILACEHCHEQSIVPDPNKTCPICGSKLRTSDSIHGGGFRSARRACSNRSCKYSVVLASFVVSVRDGTPEQGPSYLAVARAIQEGKLRLEWDR